MTRDLLLFARPRPPHMAPVKLQAVLREAAALLSNSPEHSGARVTLCGSDPTLPGDAAQLKDTFLSLLLNAAQAMPADAEIRVCLEPRDGSVRVTVHDSGPGIPLQYRERVFEPFFTTKHRGSGLGLTIVRSQVEAQGGEISIACPEEGGTAVTVSLRAEADHTG